MKQILIKKGLYYDSVKLMIVTNELNAVEGVENAAIMMGTDLNKASLERMGLVSEEINSAGPSDLIIGIEATDEKILNLALDTLNRSLNASTEGKTETDFNPLTLSRALQLLPTANLCVISVPGAYAADEAKEALEAGLHVMLFSDNVSLEDELKLKQMAEEKDLMLMGPDCGTAMINGAPLCFANKVRKGSIGIVGASGTGSQEVMSLVHKLGGGISQVIGTGGRDLREEVDGIMTIMALRAFQEDSDTKVITLVSKPPADSVVNKILNVIKQEIRKPVVLNFLGKKFEKEKEDNVYYASNLKDAAVLSLRIAGGKSENVQESKKVPQKTRIGFVKGLYSGGSLAYECMFRLEEVFGTVESNLSKSNPVKDIHKLSNHTAIDFGEDEYTQGRPHPMIDSTLRSQIFREQLDNPSTAVIILDFVLGYGASLQPHAAFVKILNEYKNDSKPLPVVVADVCGTDEDPQNYSSVIQELKNAGVIVKESNWEAVNYAISLIGREEYA